MMSLRSPDLEHQFQTSVYFESPRSLVKIQADDLAALEQSPRICISNEFLGETDGAPGTTLQEPLGQSFPSLCDGSWEGCLSLRLREGIKKGNLPAGFFGGPLWPPNRNLPFGCMNFILVESKYLLWFGTEQNNTHKNKTTTYLKDKEQPEQGREVGHNLGQAFGTVHGRPHGADNNSSPEGQPDQQKFN